MENPVLNVVLYVIETLAIISMIGVTISFGLETPGLMAVLIPLDIIHIVVFIFNLKTKYKYFPVSIITKMFLGMALPFFLMAFSMSFHPIVIVNSFVFFVSIPVTVISKGPQRRPINSMAYANPQLIAANPQQFGMANPQQFGMANPQQFGMANQPNVVYVQPQQPYYAMPPNAPGGNVPMVQGYNGYVQPQYYPPPQGQQFQAPNVAPPSPTVNPGQGGEGINQVDKPN